MDGRPSGAKQALILGIISLLLASSFWALAADLSEGEQQFRAGNYSNAISLAEQALQNRSGNEESELLLTKARNVPDMAFASRLSLATSKLKVPASFLIRTRPFKALRIG